uniref:Uncharacterized protein n=1 Tax=Pipistrellus kuhlii TaxID=59472 RepID=A0A7J7S412_PIPKU|nr:hypothetical protein mPipKuh1_001908 [Pipistrellus kuhlii]
MAEEEAVTVSGGDQEGLLRREYAAINSMLDQINTCLDHLEEQNDHLHARLQELLESNRQTRLEFQQQLGEDLDDDEDDDDDEYYYDAYDAIYEDDAGA